MEGEERAGAGMGEAEFGGVEEVAGEGDGFKRAAAGFLHDFDAFLGADFAGCAVEGIAGDGVAEGAEVDADLVGAACFNADADEGERAEAGVDAADDAPMGDGGARAGDATRSHAGTADGIAANGGADGAARRLEVAMDEGDVGFGESALGEHGAEFAVGRVVAGDDDEAAGLAVEPVDDAGAESVAAAGAELAVVVEEGVDEGAAVAGVFLGLSVLGVFGVCIGACAGAGVDEHASGFVDDGQVSVLVNDGEGNGFRGGTEGGEDRLAEDLNLFAAFEAQGGFGGSAIDEDARLLEEELDAGAADAFELGGEPGVEAGVGGFEGNSVVR